MSTRRFGVIYKSKGGQELVVATDRYNEAIPDLYSSDSSVLAFYSKDKAHKFMSHWTAQGYMAAERELDGEYKVIELEPVYSIVNWRFPEKIEDKPKWTDCWHCFGDGFVEQVGIEGRWEERCEYCDAWEKRNEMD